MLDTITSLSSQWANRPDDERWLSLPDLLDHTLRQRERSTASVISNRAIRFEPSGEDHADLTAVIRRNGREDGQAIPTNWSFGQIAALSGAPASYLRKLPTDIVADCVNYGLRFNRDVEEVGILTTADENGEVAEVRAATGPNYGRVWNADIIQALIDRFGDGVKGPWKVPGEFGRDVPITKRNTTIYGSDRDIYIGLADEKNRIEVPGEEGDFARGLLAWNSEVGAGSLGAAFYLHKYTCMNRIVWGVRDFQEMRLRHTSGAPDRWLEQIAPVIKAYGEASEKPVLDTIAAAKAKKLDDVDEFLRKRFARNRAEDIKQTHILEENRPIETIWDAVMGVTAVARVIPYHDDRVALERAGGAILDLVAV